MFAKILVFIAVAAITAEANQIGSFNQAWANSLYSTMVPGVVTLGPENTVKIVPATDVAPVAEAAGIPAIFAPAPGVRCFCTGGANAGRFIGPMGPMATMGSMGPMGPNFFGRYGRYNRFGRPFNGPFGGF